MESKLISRFLKAVAAIPQKIAEMQESVDKLTAEVQTVRAELENHIAEDQWGEMKQRRIRILRFADEVRDGKSPSKEHWDDIIEDIDHYEEYCSTHPDYHNNKGQMAMRYLKNKYYGILTEEERMEDDLK